ncbi:MAG: hypothetical protein EA397_02745 [Deltaproteobacteria bacterium]|nr:MAG: hypothetical protein EA397_02745 [Deltaproteobacteria bacterium]
MRHVLPLLLFGCTEGEILFEASSEPTDLADTNDPDNATDATSEPEATPQPRFAPATLHTTVPGPGGLVLPIQVWYPAQENAASSLHSYDGLVRGHALDNAPAACDEPRPVIAFSHGNLGVRWQSLTITEELARYGFIVVSPDHVGNTLGGPAFALSVLVQRRPYDLIQAYNGLFNLPALSGCLDPDAGYLTVGHSFGGYTALMAAGATLPGEAIDELCRAGNSTACGLRAQLTALGVEGDFEPGDARVRGVAVLAPWDATLLGEGAQDVRVPSLYLTGAGDPITPLDTMVRPLWDQMGATPTSLGVLPGGGHFSFVYDCEAVGGSVADGCGPNATPLPLIHDLTVQAVLTLAGQTGLLPAESPLPRADEIDWHTR